MVGTVAYMAPEQARGECAVDHRTDIYGLGALLYRAMSGSPPHTASDQRALVQKVILERPSPLNQVCRDLPGDICAAVDRALAHSPEHRFQTADDFGDALLRCLRREIGSTANRRSPTLTGVGNRKNRSFWGASLLGAAIGGVVGSSPIPETRPSSAAAASAVSRMTSVSWEPCPGSSSQRSSLVDWASATTQAQPAATGSTEISPSAHRQPSKTSSAGAVPSFDLRNPYAKKDLK